MMPAMNSSQTGPTGAGGERRRDMVLVGAPGSGKGTQAARLHDELGLPHIASGDLFRDNRQRQTELGKAADGYMQRGELVPDALTVSMIRERLARPDTAPGFILDGFPRNLDQARALDRMMAEMGRRLTGVLYIDVPDREILRRITGRLICRNCQAPYHREFSPPKTPGVCDRCGGELYQRGDDNAETVRTRLETFHRQTQPLIDFYRDRDLLVHIEGEGTPDEVAQRTRAAAAAL